MTKNGEKNRTEKERQRAQKKRTKTLTYLKRKNTELAHEIEKKIDKMTLTQVEKDLADKFIKSLYRCATLSLWSVGHEISLVTSLTCGHKLCNICNWSRQKKIRTKYFMWFENNKELYRLMTTGKVVTKSQYERKYIDLPAEPVQYDLMHLTLTVPHTVDGWKDNKFYFKELIKCFNFLRKKEEWLKWVYGGEYGVESSKNEQGYHIHIHALLFVKRAKQNRNQLHKIILRLWNSLTIDDNANRGELTEYEITSILKGNRTLKRQEVANLSPKGATIINLETIYSVDEKGNKHRNIEYNSKAMLFAVMETISYHFKPKIFEQTETRHDIQAVIELLPLMYRQILYKKFGCLHGEKSLNIKDDTLLDEYSELEENIEVDENTGEIVDKRYFITNPMNIYLENNENIRIKRNAQNIIKLETNSSSEAVNVLYQYYKK